MWQTSFSKHTHSFQISRTSCLCIIELSISGPEGSRTPEYACEGGVNAGLLTLHEMQSDQMSFSINISGNNRYCKLWPKVLWGLNHIKRCQKLLERTSFFIFSKMTNSRYYTQHITLPENENVHQVYIYCIPHVLTTTSMQASGQSSHCGAFPQAFYILEQLAGISSTHLWHQLSVHCSSTMLILASFKHIGC